MIGTELRIGVWKMKIRKILEEYETTCRISDREFNIYSNPSKKEIEEVSEEYNNQKSLRFIASPLKNSIYIFSPSLLHGIAIKKIYKDCNIKIGVGKSMLGTATLINGRWKINTEETKGPELEEAKEEIKDFISKTFLSF